MLMNRRWRTILRRSVKESVVKLIVRYKLVRMLSVGATVVLAVLWREILLRGVWSPGRHKTILSSVTVRYSRGLRYTSLPGFCVLENRDT